MNSAEGNPNVQEWRENPPYSRRIALGLSSSEVPVVKNPGTIGRRSPVHDVRNRAPLVSRVEFRLPRKRLLIRDNANVGHHASILVLEDMAVVHEITHLRKRNADIHRLDLTGSRTPCSDRTVAG